MSTYKKRNSGKGLKALAIAVAAIVVVGATYTGLSVGLGSWNPAHWTGENLEQELTPEQQSGAILEETSSNGVKLTSNTIAVADYENYGISPLAETAYTLTATVYDEGGSSVGIPQNVNFSAAWENPSSAWASGKDIADYYSVTSTGINTATGACLQAFGEPIIITATAAFNEDAYTTWEANYVKRVESISCTTNGALILDDVRPFNYDFTLGTGTLTGTLHISGGVVSEEGNHMSYESGSLNNPFMNYFKQQAESADITLDWSSLCPVDISYVDDDYGNTEYIEFGISLESMLLENMSSEDVNTLRGATNNFEYFKYAYNYAADQGTNDFRFELTYTYRYNGEIYSSGTALSDWVELSGDYPVQSSVSGNEIDLIY